MAPGAEPGTPPGVLSAGEPAKLRARAALPVPVGDLLCEQPPEH